jgi:tRNA A37 threonylcarbamoyladenosine biosynthesis protein TsaE
VESLDEVLDLALGELVEDAAVALVEWGELAASVFGRDVMTIDFRVEDDDARMLTVDGELATSRAARLERWAP